MATTPARKRLQAAARAHQRTEDRLARTREELHAAILAAIDAGERQVDIVHDTGYTRETIRLLQREREQVT